MWKHRCGLRRRVRFWNFLGMSLRWRCAPEILFLLFWEQAIYLAEFIDKAFSATLSVTFHRKVETCLAKESLRALKASRLMNNGELSSTLILKRFHSIPTFHPFQSHQQVNFAVRRFQGNFLPFVIVPPNASSFSQHQTRKRDKLHACVKVPANYKPAHRLIDKQISICFCSTVVDWIYCGSIGKSRQVQRTTGYRRDSLTCAPRELLTMQPHK